MSSFGVIEGLFLRGALFLDILIRDYDYGEALHRESHRRDSLRFNLQVIIDSCQDIDQHTFQLRIGSKSSTFELKYIYRSFLSVPT